MAPPGQSINDGSPKAGAGPRSDRAPAMPRGRPQIVSVSRTRREGRIPAGVRALCLAHIRAACRLRCNPPYRSTVWKRADGWFATVGPRPK